MKHDELIKMRNALIGNPTEENIAIVESINELLNEEKAYKTIKKYISFNPEIMTIEATGETMYLLNYKTHSPNDKYMGLDDCFHSNKNEYKKFVELGYKALKSVKK